MSRSFKRAALALALIGCVTASISWTVHAQQAQSVSQGVYTDAQARRGADTYKASCASCHGESLGGSNAPPLVGNDFVSNWSKDPLSDLFSKIRNTMPQDAPGKLTAAQTADVVAYILQAGKFPSGRTELRSDDEALKQISWPATARAATTGTSPAVSFPPAGNLAQVMRGILFPSSNIIFTVQTHDPGQKRTTTGKDATDGGGFDFTVWGGSIYSGWEVVDYAAIALAESAPLMLTPGRKCENGKPVPVNDPEWIKFTNELAEAGKAAYKASQSRNQEAVSDISNQVSESCQNCHQVYRDKRRPGGNLIDLAGKANRCTK
jgi:quinoprotein glucose dehydrogenase